MWLWVCLEPTSIYLFTNLHLITLLDHNWKTTKNIIMKMYSDMIHTILQVKVFKWKGWNDFIYSELRINEMLKLGSTDFFLVNNTFHLKYFWIEWNFPRTIFYILFEKICFAVQSGKVFLADVASFNSNCVAFISSRKW